MSPPIEKEKRSKVSIKLVVAAHRRRAGSPWSVGPARNCSPRRHSPSPEPGRHAEGPEEDPGPRRHHRGFHHANRTGQSVRPHRPRRRRQLRGREARLQKTLPARALWPPRPTLPAVKTPAVEKITKRTAKSLSRIAGRLSRCVDARGTGFWGGRSEVPSENRWAGPVGG